MFSIAANGIIISTIPTNVVTSITFTLSVSKIWALAKFRYRRLHHLSVLRHFHRINDRGSSHFPGTVVNATFLHEHENTNRKQVGWYLVNHLRPRIPRWSNIASKLSYHVTRNLILGFRIVLCNHLSA